jgi:hypothetical protein
VRVVVQALPNSKGAFARGCVDRFTLLSEGGDIGDITAVKVWHEGPGRIDMAYCLERVEIESKYKGIKYRWAALGRAGGGRGGGAAGRRRPLGVARLHAACWPARQPLLPPCRPNPSSPARGEG